MVSSIDELVRTATALDDTKSALLWQSILQVVIQRVAANAYVARDLRLAVSYGDACDHFGGLQWRQSHLAASVDMSCHDYGDAC